jgi:3-hydroxyacyl-CoA dehydrogenase
MIDLVGLDTRLSILNFLHQTLGEKYRPCPLLVEYVKDGRVTPSGVAELKKRMPFAAVSMRRRPTNSQ